MAPRTFANDVTLTFGPLSARGRLVGVKDSSAGEPGFKLCSPNGKAVEQRYVDEDGNVFERDQLGRAYIDDEGNLVQVDPEMIAEAKSSVLPLNSITLRSHPADEVNKYLYPSGKHQGYIFEPTWRNSKNKMVREDANTQVYDLLAAIVESSPVAFLSQANLQNHEGLFRAGIYQGMIVIQRQLVPSELHQFNYDRARIQASVMKKAKALADSLVEDFNFDTYKNEVTERLLTAQTNGFTPSGMPDREPTVIDFDKVLDAFLK